MRLEREFYIPKGAEKIESPKAPAVVYKTTNTAGKPAARGFYGKAAKPVFNFYFGDEARRDTFVNAWLAKMEARSANMAARAAERAAKLAKPQEFLKVGDVLRNSWGYDQTNVDYFEVTELIGKRTVVIKPLAQEVTETGFMCGNCRPVPGKYLDKPALRKQVGVDGAVKIHEWGSWARKVEKTADGSYESSYWSSYA